jgi:amino acid transporter
MATGAAPGAQGELARRIGPRLLLFFILGDILGAGIYALVGEVGAETGGAIWAAFALALALAVFTAFSYAELVTKYPHAGGAAHYVNRAFRLPFVSFMVAFAVMASGITSAGTLSRAFGGDYLAEFVDLPVAGVAIAFLLVVAAINYRGISESVRVNVVLTTVELTGLLLIVLIGAVALGDGSADAGRPFEFDEGSSVPLAILAGAALAFYALIGFEDSVNVAEETERPNRTYPRALFAGIFVAGVIYLLVTFMASAVVPTDRLAGSDGPLLEVVEIGPLGIPTRLFAAIALLAVANGALINMIMASRLVYGMARQGIAPEVLGRVDEARRTPYVAIAFTTLLGVILVATGDLGTLADTTVLLLLIVFTLVNVAVLRLRSEPVEHEHFVAPPIFPVLGIAVCLGLMTQQDLEIVVRAGVLLLVGVGFWVASRAAPRRDREAEGDPARTVA